MAPNLSIDREHVIQEYIDVRLGHWIKFFHDGNQSIHLFAFIHNLLSDFFFIYELLNLGLV